MNVNTEGGGGGSRLVCVNKWEFASQIGTITCNTGTSRQTSSPDRALRASNRGKIIFSGIKTQIPIFSFGDLLSHIGARVLLVI
jgi:hypothetical protein